MRRSVVPAGAVAGILATTTAVAATIVVAAPAAVAGPSDPSPSGPSRGAWTVIDRRDADTTADADRALPRRLAPVPSPVPRNARTTRSGPRRPLTCVDTSGGVWLVRPGDTLWRVSVCTGRALTALVRVNGLPDGGNLIFPGDRIRLP